MLALKKPKAKLQKINLIITLFIALFLGVSCYFISYSRILYEPDEFITNYIYSYNPFEKADSRITIVAIDDASIDSYGDYSDWSRTLLADAVNKLSEDNAAVIGLDTDLSNEGDGDSSLVNACSNSQNVVVMAGAQFDSDIEQKPEPNDAFDSQDDNSSSNFAIPADSSLDWKNHETTNISYPFKDLADVTTIGITNAVQQSMDGTIHSAALAVQFDKNPNDSFATAIYKKYMDSIGSQYSFPSLDSSELFGFHNIINLSSYQIISFSELLSDNYDKSLIENNIVLIGELDTIDESQNYIKNIRSGFINQEILLESSIINALLNQKVIIDVDKQLQAILFALIIVIANLILSNRRLIFVFIFNIILFISGIGSAYLLNTAGYRLLLLVPMIYMLASLFIQMIYNLIIADFQKKKMENTLKMYVDSQVVDEISEVAPFMLSSLSERKNITVLFVDIRGFTTMSEHLEPEKVVEILNKYFTVIYASITAWNGTLDKFIGDAAMAIFNAPKDVPDHIFNAVCAASDILLGFEDVKREFYELYGSEINIGIGINCGDAIVGNIGCLGRMDYTAIGDTVNTASRLESNAKPGQILISQSIRNALSDRIKTNFVGNLTLKGKSNTFATYEVTECKKPEPPNAISRKEIMHEAALLYSKIRSNR